MAINLNKREKLSVIAAAAALFIFVLLQFLVFPLLEKNDRLSSKLISRQHELEQIRLLQAEYRQTSQKAEQAQRFIKRRKPGFTLFSFLETLAGKTNVKNNIAYMRPTSTADKDSPYRLSLVEMKLADITTSQLMAYLHGIEASNNMIFVKRLSISKEERKADLITTVFQVETLEK
jgi:general secretion pathway protein M